MHSTIPNLPANAVDPRLLAPAPHCCWWRWRSLCLCSVGTIALFVFPLGQEQCLISFPRPHQLRIRPLPSLAGKVEQWWCMLLFSFLGFFSYSFFFLVFIQILFRQKMPCSDYQKNQMLAVIKLKPLFEIDLVISNFETRFTLGSLLTK